MAKTTEQHILTKTTEENLKEQIECLERMKEVYRIQYDYFKHLTTLASGSVLFMVVFWDKVFSALQIASKLFGLVSILGFASTIIFSLSALPNAGNIILYIIALQRAQAEKDLKEASTMTEKIRKALDNIHFNNCASGISYGLGILSLLLFAAINIIN